MLFRSSVALALAIVALLQVAECGDTHIELETLAPNTYAEFEAKEGWDWTRDKFGNYDMHKNLKYIITKYYAIEKVLKMMCNQVGLDTCQPYFVAMRQDLNKTLEAASDAIIYFDHFVLETRKKQSLNRPRVGPITRAPVRRSG